MSNLRNIVGKNIKKIRKIRNLTQAQLAQKANIDIATIARIETGLSFPREENLSTIAQILNIDVYVLFKNRKVEREDIIMKANDTIKTLDNKNLAIISNILDIMESY